MTEKNSASPEFIANISNNIMIEAAKSGHILFFNGKAACVFCGISRSGRLEDVIPADNFAVLRQNIDTALYQQYPHHFYWSFQSRFYLIYIYPREKSVWLCMDDITEKRQQAHLLHLNSQRTMFAERIARLGYWELDVALKRFYWSDEMYKIFGINEAGQTYHQNLIRELIHPDDLPVYKQKLKELIKIRQDIDGQVRIITPDKVLKYCRFMAGIIYENGEPKIAGAFQDISDLIITQIELEKAKKAADEANLAKSYFLAQASHDIRQPLQAIDLFVEGLKSAPKNKYPEIIDKISSLSRNLTAMLNNLLDISKLDSGGMSFETQNFNLAELLEKICAEYYEMAHSRNIELKCRLQNHLINQDSFLVERIVRNLLSNALKHARSKITVGNTGSVFWVVDDGKGIDKDKQKHIFDVFYQCDTSADKRKSGAGLGLNIVSKIAEVIGAEIVVKSSPGHYTVFKVRL